ncbi:MAG TPA: carboxypeptidase regulatory-like domain-containing protein [Acidisarcina sp.]
MNKNFFPRVVMAAIIIALCSISQMLNAQTTQGAIAGNVLDSSGAVVPNAAITAKSEDSGNTYNTVSTTAGDYRFPSVPLGHYTLTTTATGFKSVVNTGVEVRVGSTTSFDITLTVGGTSETVTVQSDAPTIETQTSDVSGTVTARQIVDLPLALGGVGAMRSPEAFVFLIPGTTGPGSANSSNGIFLNKLGGGQNFGNEILLDGASVIRTENGSSFDETAPSVEAISEFKVTTSTPAAEFGRTTGGIENFVTKSGTNRYHGTAFDIFRNEDLNANDWFNNGKKAYLISIGNPFNNEQTYNRSPDKKNDYGGSLGGPVIIPHLYHGRDKTFFFFAWEQYRQTLGGQFTSTVPTTAERGGNFQDRLLGPNGQINPCDGSPIFIGEIFDPATTQTVGGTVCRLPFGTPPATATSPIPANFNVIPQSRFSTVGSAIAAFYPNPTSGGLNGNYVLNSSSPVTNTTYTIRIDETLNAKNSIFGSYNTRENGRYNPPNRAFTGPADYNTQLQDFITHFGRAGWDYVISPSLLNHLNLGYNRTYSNNGSFEALSGINYAKQLGIANITTGLPRFNLDGYSPISRNQDALNVDNGIRVNDTVSWQRGRNSFKFGIDYRYQQYSSIAADGVNGYFNFTVAQTKASQTGPFQNGTGNGFASLLLGTADFGGASVPFHQAQWLQDYYAAFFQDDFKVSNNLVLNLGIRYDLDRPRREKHNDTSNFSATAIDPKNGLPGALVFASNCTGCNKRWADTWKKDFAPRIGFAFTPSSMQQKMVLRGGFAILYAPLQYSDFGGDTRTGYTANVSFGSDGFNPAFSIDNGLPAYTTGINLDPGQLDSGNANAPTAFGNFIKPSYGRPGMLNQWNLQVQQEVAKDLIVTLGYIGSSGAHLKSQEENINNIQPSNFIRGDALTSHNLAANGITPPYMAFNGQVQQALRPFPQYAFIATDCCLQNVGHSSYDALVASVERRFAQGLNLQASYTWSKTITNADSIINVTNGVQQEQNPFNSKSQKSLSNQDIPHTFVVSYLYQLPIGKDHKFINSNNFLTRTLLSGFEIGGVQRYQSGEPFTFGCASGIPGWDNCISFTRIPGSSISSNARKSGHLDVFRQFRNNNLPPGVAPDPSIQAGPDPNIDSIFNGLLMPMTAPTPGHPSVSDNPGYAALQTNPAFIDQNTFDNRRLRAIQFGTDQTACPTCDNGGFLFGNVPRVTGEARNFIYLNEDFSILKRTPITEGSAFILKIELLNAFNRHVFATPSTQPYDPFFGVPTATIDGPRNVQITGRIEF